MLSEQKSKEEKHCHEIPQFLSLSLSNVSHTLTKPNIHSHTESLSYYLGSATRK